MVATAGAAVECIGFFTTSGSCIAVSCMGSCVAVSCMAGINLGDSRDSVENLRGVDCLVMGSWTARLTYSVRNAILSSSVVRYVSVSQT